MVLILADLTLLPEPQLKSMGRFNNRRSLCCWRPANTFVPANTIPNL